MCGTVITFLEILQKKETVNLLFVVRKSTCWFVDKASKIRSISKVAEELSVQSSDKNKAIKANSVG